MLSLKMRIGLIIILIIGLIVIYHMVKKRKLELKYSLSWIFLDLVVLIMVSIPQAMGGLANILGIYNETNMVFFLGFIFVIIVIFIHTISISYNDTRVRKLAQEQALSEYNTKKMLEEINK